MSVEIYAVNVVRLTGHETTGGSSLFDMRSWLHEDAEETNERFFLELDVSRALRWVVAFETHREFDEGWADLGLPDVDLDTLAISATGGDSAAATLTVDASSGDRLFVIDRDRFTSLQDQIALSLDRLHWSAPESRPWRRLASASLQPDESLWMVRERPS